MPTVTIRIYEGERSGIRKLTEKDRKRVIFRFDRGSMDELERLVEREHGRTSSYVYIIESSGGLQRPYVGYSTISRGAGFGKRLRDHMSDGLGNWDIGYAILSDDLGDSSAKALESYLINGARCGLSNRHESHLPRLNEDEEGTYLSMIDDLEDRLGMLQCPIFRAGAPPARPVAELAEEESNPYAVSEGASAVTEAEPAGEMWEFCLRTRDLGVIAYGSSPDPDAKRPMTVRRGSRVVAPAIDKACGSRREKLESSGVISDGVFTADYEFDTPTAASDVILGSHVNGRKRWERIG